MARMDDGAPFLGYKIHILDDPTRKYNDEVGSNDDSGMFGELGEANKLWLAAAVGHFRREMIWMMMYES